MNVFFILIPFLLSVIGCYVNAQSHHHHHTPHYKNRQNFDHSHEDHHQRSGHRHSGEGHSGERYMGERHSGERHSGGRHSVERHSSERHSGDRHSGERHSGERHSGDRHLLTKTLDERQSSWREITKNTENSIESPASQESSNESLESKKYPQGRGVLGGILRGMFGAPPKSKQIKVDQPKETKSEVPADAKVKGYIHQLEVFLKARIAKMSKDGKATEVKGPITAISFLSENVSSEDKSDTISNGIHYFVKIGAKVIEGGKEGLKYYHVRVFKDEGKDPPVVVGMDNTNRNGERALKDKLKPFGIYTDLGNDPLKLPTLTSTFLMF